VRARMPALSCVLRAVILMPLITTLYLVTSYGFGRIVTSPPRMGVTNFGHFSCCDARSGLVQPYSSRRNTHSPLRLKRSTNFRGPTHALNLRVTVAEKYGTSMFTLPTVTRTGSGPTDPNVLGELAVVRLVDIPYPSYPKFLLFKIKKTIILGSGRNSSYSKGKLQQTTKERKTKDKKNGVDSAVDRRA